MTDEQIQAPPVTETPAATAPIPEAPKVPETLLSTPAPEAPKTEPEAQFEFKFDELKLPEGLQLGDEDRTALTTIATENKIAPAQLQPLLDLHTKLAKTQAEASAKAWESTNEKWVSEVKAMPEFAGEKLVGAQKIISDALNEYGSPGVREAFGLTGAGNNPEIFRTFYAMAKALSEGKSAIGGKPGGNAPKSMAEAFYPTLAQG